MRLLLASLFVVLALPVAAFATDAPSPTTVAACQAEYAQVGADAFKAKYGATEPFGHCYAAHASAVTTTTPTTSGDDPAAAACKAEYLKLGATAFMAKYGATEAYGNCLKAFSAPKTQPKPSEPSSDSPAVAACKAEYLKIGGSAFMAKYGANEPLSACVKAQDPPKTSAPSSDSPAVAACRAEYLKIGGSAFNAKYGSNDPLSACVKAQSKSNDKPKPSTSNGDDGAASVASAFCSTEGKALGTAVFLVKYGPKEAMGNCVKAALAKAKSLVASCKSSSGTSKDAFKACIAAGIQPRRR